MHNNDSSGVSTVSNKVLLHRRLLLVSSNSKWGVIAGQWVTLVAQFISHGHCNLLHPDYFTSPTLEGDKVNVIAHANPQGRFMWHLFTCAWCSLMWFATMRKEYHTHNFECPMWDQGSYRTLTQTFTYHRTTLNVPCETRIVTEHQLRLVPITG